MRRQSKPGGLNMPQHDCHRNLRPRAIFLLLWSWQLQKRPSNRPKSLNQVQKVSQDLDIWQVYTPYIRIENVTVCLSMPRIKSLSPKILINVDWNFDMWKNVDWKSVNYKNLCNILILCLLLIFETKTQKKALVSIRTTDVRWSNTMRFTNL